MKTIRPGKSALNTKNVNAPIWPIGSEGSGEVKFTNAEKSEPQPEKIPGLVWVPESDTVLNLNHFIAAKRNDNAIDFYTQNSTHVKARFYFSATRCSEVLDKIRAMGVEL